LSALALRSKSHWGYDPEFLDAVRVGLTFTGADFEAGPIWALDLDGELTGVYHIVGEPPEGELAGLWLDPHAIGSGLGRVLYLHALDTAAEGGLETLLIESDPNAMGFYLAMGAGHVGHRRSQAGRWLPLLRVAVASAPARLS
jgi:GNAT superfamily N-acetyltransferase